MRTLFRAICLIIAIGGSAGIAAAAPAIYALDTTQSAVKFETDFGADRINGQMPVLSADLSLDFVRMANSRIAVVLDVASSVASFPFAAQAMKGPKVLNARDFPQITFQSTSVRKDGEGAVVEGNLTIRGQTRPVVLNANIWRQSGTEAGDLNHLTVRLVGAVSRSAFGATGWSDAVGDEVRLDIIARVQKVN
jgi:polyisoprenoid-binding protein YceI